MKLLLVANTGWNLYNFRRNLARELQAQGVEVGLVCPADRYASMLEAEGFRHVAWNVSRSGVNPVRELNALRHLAAIYRREQPQLTHHFTIKCIVYGTLAARWSGVPRIVNTVTGLGHVYLSNSPAMRLLRPLLHRWYSWSLSARGVRTMFQNRDDLHVLASQVPHLARRAVLCNGSGVDLQRFAPGPVLVRPDEDRPAVVLFAGAAHCTKGNSGIRGGSPRSSGTRIRCTVSRMRSDRPGKSILSCGRAVHRMARRGDRRVAGAR